MTKRIDFDPLWTTEQRKAAINRALEQQMPFQITAMKVNGPFGKLDYTGGNDQLTTAKSISINIIRL